LGLSRGNFKIFKIFLFWLGDGVFMGFVWGKIGWGLFFCKKNLKKFLGVERADLWGMSATFNIFVIFSQ